MDFLSLHDQPGSYNGIYQLDEEFRYLQRKKNVVKELAEVRRKVRFSHITCHRFLNCVINVEYHLPGKPDEVSRRTAAYYFAHVQSLPG